MLYALHCILYKYKYIKCTMHITITLYYLQRARETSTNRGNIKLQFARNYKLYRYTCILCMDILSAYNDE